MNIYYVYLYLRSKESIRAKQGTPYYVGKGKNNRAYTDHGRVRLPESRDLIQVVADNLTEEQAFELEKQLIKEWGRVDLGTGILYNLTDGGEGGSGYIVSEETKLKKSKIQSDIRKSWGDEKTQDIIQKCLHTFSKRSPELKQEISEKISNSWKSRSPEQLEIISHKISNTLKQTNSTRTDEEKECINQKRRETRKNWSVERTQQYLENRKYIWKEHTSKKLDEINQKKSVARSSWTDEFKQSIAEKNRETRKNWNPEYRAEFLERNASISRGTIWINDGLTDKRWSKDQSIPAGWVRGRSKTTGRVWVSNGVESKKIKLDDVLPSGWYYGRKIGINNHIGNN